MMRRQRDRNFDGAWMAESSVEKPSCSRGSVTAEFAVVLPAVTALLGLLLLGAGAGIRQLSLEEGARAGARALARGESNLQAVEIATRAAGSQATVEVNLAGGYATVTVSSHLEGPFAAAMPWQQTAQATTRVENYGTNTGQGVGL